MVDCLNWRHVFKLDPEKELDDRTLQQVCQSGTDAVIVGGTTGVTFANTFDLLARIRRYPLPCALEVSGLQAVVPGFDLYLIPLVLNAGSTDWIFAPHVRGLKEYGAVIPWEQVITEGYVVLNQASAVAGLTQSRADLTLQDVVAYARLADKLLGLPVFYLEYSGTYGDPALVKEVKGVLENSCLFYGGGICTGEQAREMASLADTIVVGNIIYEDLPRALETVNAARSIAHVAGK